MGNLLQTFILDSEVSSGNVDVNSISSDGQWESAITSHINHQTALAAYAAVVAASILILMALEKRKSCCLRFFNGRFALVIPVNFLEGRKKRKVIVAVFALATIEILSMLATTTYTKGQPNYIQVLIKLVLTALMALIFLPMLSCIYMASLPSCLLGLVYTFLYILNIIIQSVPTRTVSTQNLVKELAIRILVVPIAGTYIIFWFAKRIFLIVCFGPDKVETMSPRQMKYIRNLLLCKDKYEAISQHQIEVEHTTSKLLIWIRQNIYHNVHGFRYSLSILISCVVGFLIITKTAIDLMYSCTVNFIEFRIQLEQKENEKDEMIPNFIKMILQFLFQSRRNGGIGKIENISELTLWKHITLILYVAILLALLTAYIMNSVTVCHMLMAYRKNVLDIYRKKHQHNCVDCTSTSNADIVLYAIQFTGYQVAYLMWGFIIQFFVLCAILVVGGELMILPLIHAFDTFLIWLLDYIGPIVAVIIFTRGAQFLLIRYVFLIDYGKTMALDNRRGFFIMMYIVFFYNIFTGIFSCLKRILIGMIVGIYLVPRLDRCVLPKDFEDKDEGYKSYTCLLYLEATQSNPVVRCFIDILAKLHYTELENAIWKSYDYDEWFFNPSYYEKKKKARIRWFLAYTLLRNTSIIKFRKHQLTLTRSSSTSSSTTIIRGVENSANALVLNDKNCLHDFSEITIDKELCRNERTSSNC